MALVVRHGGESHVMRPDRVYRTSVLSPMMNYSPQADVQAVAYAFTQGPPLGTMLQGLGAPSLMDRIKAFFNRGKATAVAVQQAMKPTTTIPGPAINESNTVAPQMRGPMEMMMRLSHAGMNPGAFTAGRALSKRRYFTYYKAG